MRVLFDQAVYDMRNKGNLALLQVAVARIQDMWPDASLEVLTLSPHLLKLYCPAAKPIRPDGQDEWSKTNRTYNLIQAVLPRLALRYLFELREAAWRRKKFTHEATHGMSGVGEQGIKAASQDKMNKVYDYTKLIQGADLFIATGAQYMSDACRDDALQVLDRLEAAYNRGVPTVMVGQGFGPIKDFSLIEKSKHILPLVDLIFVRERIVSPQLLTSFGVNPSRILLTGDDAIELAYQSRTKILGNDIGIGLRKAQYTEVNSRHIEILRSVFQKINGKYKNHLVPIPISHSAHEMDDAVLNQLLSGFQNVSSDWRRFNSPEQIIKKVGRCRLVVAGTFHTIVFALSQGIPAISLAKSEMYQEKFLGLVDLFGPACQIIQLDATDFEQQLLVAIDRAWNSAELVKPDLLDAAKKQIESGKAAYQRIFDLVSTKETAATNKPIFSKESLEPK